MTEQHGLFQYIEKLHLPTKDKEVVLSALEIASLACEGPDLLKDRDPAQHKIFHTTVKFGTESPGAAFLFSLVRSLARTRPASFTPNEITILIKTAQILGLGESLSTPSEPISLFHFLCYGRPEFALELLRKKDINVDVRGIGTNFAFELVPGKWGDVRRYSFWGHGTQKIHELLPVEWALKSFSGPEPSFSTCLLIETLIERTCDSVLNELNVLEQILNMFPITPAKTTRVRTCCNVFNILSKRANADGSGILIHESDIKLFQSSLQDQKFVVWLKAIRELENVQRTYETIIDRYDRQSEYRQLIPVFIVDALQINLPVKQLWKVILAYVLRVEP
jgi:hypothetical protein